MSPELAVAAIAGVGLATAIRVTRILVLRKVKERLHRVLADLQQAQRMEGDTNYREGQIDATRTALKILEEA